MSWSRDRNQSGGRAVASLGTLALMLSMAVAASTNGADEPRGLGRLFRIGSSGANPSANGSARGPASNAPKGSVAGSGSGSAAGAMGGLNAQPMSMTPTNGLGSGMGAGGGMGMGAYGQPALTTPTSAGSGSTGPKLTPKPRNNKPATESDPLVSRVAIGRSNEGGQFGMFLMIYADGTLVDGEGVRKISPEMLKPVVDAVAGGDFGRVKGHCGGPAGDTFENFQVVTFERSYGKLRANAFSYSGNPQGCDHSVTHLHKVLEDLQMKMSGASPTVVSPGTTAEAGPISPNGSMAPPIPLSSGEVDDKAPPMNTLGMPSLPDPSIH